MTSFIYNILLFFLFPIIGIIFFFRILLGKEDKNRFKEKFGFYEKTKHDNNHLIWFHACSVGEAKSVFSLINIFLKKGNCILITSNTKMSSVYIKKNLPKKVIHQFLPIDYQFAVKRFLNHWKPSVGIFVESEIWPNLIKISKKKNIPLCLIQASFSSKSIKKWFIFKSFFESIMKNFNFIIAQSNDDKNKIIKQTSIKVSNVFNMKLSSEKLWVNLKETKKIKKSLENNTVISAVSTHAGEERILINIFYKMKKRFKKIILFIQPRHPLRKKEIINILKENKLNYRVRSDLEYPDKDTDVYLCDTFGESGNYISVSDLIILGGTLVPVGGHNLIEPAQFGKCIICGQYYFKIKDLVNMFKENEAILVSEVLNLEKLIINLLKDVTIIKETGSNAKKMTTNFRSTEKHLYNKIVSLIKKNENSRILV